MLVANSDAAGRRAGIAGLARRIVRAPERFVAGTREGVVVASALLGFVVLWTLFHLVSSASVDVHSDVSDVWMSAMDFGIGHKHPPLAAWVFRMWFAVFPRADWAIYLLTVTVVATALAVTWRLLRDHLDANRALLGIAALVLVPLYTFRAVTLDENTVMMPFWAAAVLFYLRARRGLRSLDAVLAGAFAGLAFLGKYWVIYLVAGLAITSLLGAGTRRFWRSPAPYLMAVAAAIVVAPHLYWLATGQGSASFTLVHDSVMGADPFGMALAKSAYYLFGAAAYVAGPLLLLATLRPSRAALADIAWPADADRQQALLLLAVPLILPALVNLVLPHRLTPVWTFPNWALLPIVLYGTPLVTVDARAVARAGLLALVVTLAAVAASPVLAYLRLRDGDDLARAHSRQVAQAVERFAGRSVQLFWGSEEAVNGLAFYLPAGRRLPGDPSAENRAEIGAKGLVIICLSDDAQCKATGAALAGAEPRQTDATFTRSFLGLSGRPASYRIIAVPAERANP
jgi:4-amino-4-deoxy-L-arabinose transferase-like glycosyltransferase